MWIWLALACADKPEVEEEESSSPTSSPSTPTGDTAPDTGTAPLVPIIDEALAGRCPDPGAKLKRLPPAGDDLVAVTLPDATARCNDGSPPVIYVRPATDPKHANDWVLYLDSGASCDLYEQCAQRWCSEDFYDASKMSSRWAPKSILGAGILAPGGPNPYGGWNAVHFYYCSSDYWLGQGADKVLDDGKTPYRLHFEGDLIVGQALDALETGLAEMPSLSAAGTVILTGSSAGATGAALQLDKLQARLPSAAVFGVIDSMMTPTYASFPSDEVADGYFALFDPGWDRTARLWEAIRDADCVAARGDVPECSVLAELWTGGYTTTPLLLHMDLQDTIGSPIQDLSPMSMAAYAITIEASLRDFADAGLSIHGTACGQHMAVNGPRFTTMTVDGVSLQQAVQAHLAGQTVDVVDDPLGTGSSCP